MPGQVIPMIAVSDIRAAIAFYELLGFTLVETDEFHYGEGQINWAQLSNGTARLMLRVGGDDAPQSGLSLYLTVEDVDVLHATIASLVAVTEAPEDRFYGVRDMWFRDPFGVQWGAGHPLAQSTGSPDPQEC